MLEQVNHTPAKAGEHDRQHLQQRTGASLDLHQADPRNGIAWLFEPLLEADDQKEWDKAKEVSGSFILHPDCNFNSVWDVFSMTLILYSCVTIPYRLAFKVEASGGYLIIDRVVDAIFMFDCALCFTKAIFKEGELVFAYSKIRASYLKGWFVLDFFSSFPFDLLINASGADGDPNQARLLKVIRILRMVKILRMVRIQRLLKKFQENMGIKNGIMISIKFGLFTMFAAHFQACLWFGMSESDPASNWAVSYCIKEDAEYFDESCGNVCHRVACEPQCTASDDRISCVNTCMEELGGCDAGVQYVASFYWSIVTLTTLGYGDVVPSSQSERMFCVYAMLLGASIFAYSVTNMCTLVHNLNPADVHNRNQLDELHSYMNFLKIDKALAKRCSEFLLYKHRFSKVVIYNEDLILQDMSNSMKQDVKLIALENIILAVPVFKAPEFGKYSAADIGDNLSGLLHENLLKNLAVKIESRPLSHDEVIAQEGQILTSLYIVGKGVVRLSKADNDEADNFSIGEGGWFGLSSLFRPTKLHYLATATEYVDLYSLSKFKFEEALEVQKRRPKEFEDNAIALDLITEAPEVNNAGKTKVGNVVKKQMGVVPEANYLDKAQLSQLIKIQAAYILNLESWTYGEDQGDDAVEMWDMKTRGDSVDLGQE